MKRALRRIGLSLAALVLLVVAAYWLLDAWLTGAGGRHAVERALGEHLGLPVRLRGDFAVTLLPRIGVGGTDLEVGPDGEALRGREYGLSLALKPLLHKRLVIDSVHLDGGALDLSRWGAATPPADNETAATGAGLALPEIRALTIREFDWLANGARQFRINSFQLDDFAAGQESPFELAVDQVAAVAGSLLWQPAGGQVIVSATATGNWPGVLQGQLTASLPDRRGVFDARWQAVSGPAQTPDLQLGLRWVLEEAGLQLAEIDLEARGQGVHGNGCLLTADGPALHLDLSAERLDLNPLTDLPLPGQAAGAEGNDDWPLALHLRLRATELIAGDATAHAAVLLVGGEPDCAQPGD